VFMMNDPINAMLTLPASRQGAWRDLQAFEE
jgi:hypothetical protein